MRALPLARMAAVGVAAAALLHASCGDSGPSSSTPPTTIARPSPSPTAPAGGDPFHDASCTFGRRYLGCIGPGGVRIWRKPDGIDSD